MLRAIEALLPDIPEHHQPDFGLVDYIDEKGEKRPAYKLNRNGFVVLAMGFTGKKALAFKLAYIDAFNRMERELTGQAPQLAAPATLSTAQAHAIKSAVEAKCKGDSKAYSACYHALYDAFKVPSYREIQAARFEAALSFIQSWQYTPPAQPSGPLSTPEQLIEAWFAPNGYHFDTEFLHRLATVCHERIFTAYQFQRSRASGQPVNVQWASGLSAKPTH